jgi:hypothetical protein
MHAHHVRTAANSGKGTKPSDLATVALCAAHHSEFHTGGGKTFEAKYGLDLLELAEGLAKQSPFK